MANDIQGTEIVIGSTVVFGLAQTMNLASGMVIEISDKTVKIGHTKYDHYSKCTEVVYSRRTFDNVVVVG